VVRSVRAKIGQYCVSFGGFLMPSSSVPGHFTRKEFPFPQDKTLVILSHTGVIAAENIIPSTSGYGDILVLTGTQGHSVVEQTLRDVPHRVALIPPGASAQDLAALIRHEVGAVAC